MSRFLWFTVYIK